ncbi:MAG TPA: acyl-CoA dehydrogenase family protein [Miltoncostaeaceae bacterium]|jgi:alkylation response protein AidB-like acyl-CoA dehydrogenase|nr:acyl-CoA dehydrogenase family protein [Miltoncostaeaceae bacterium]
MTTIQADGLLGAVEEIGPLLRRHAAEAEQRRRLSAATVDALRDAGLFRMFLPASLGGREMDPPAVARVVEAVARHDAAAGWALQAGNVGDWFAARLPDAGVEEVLGDDPDVVQSAAFHPPLAGEPADGGYRLSGRRPLASTIHDARWLFVTAVVGDGAVGAVVGADEVRVIDTWRSLGMRGTDSNDVELDGVFVPERRTFPLAPAFTPGSHHRGPLYRMPAVTILATVLVPVALAVAQGALDALRDLAPSKMSLGTTRALRDRSVAHVRLARAEGLVRAARASFSAALAESWERVAGGGRPTLDDRAGDLLAAVHAVTSCVEAVDLVYGVAGSAAVYERSAIERCFRDINTIRHHGFVCEGRLEAVGQVLLGLPPEFELIAF